MRQCTVCPILRGGVASAALSWRPVPVAMDLGRGASCLTWCPDCSTLFDVVVEVIGIVLLLAGIVMTRDVLIRR